MAMRRPAEVFPPGEFLREELEARGWTQVELAEIMGRHPTVINEIIQGKRGISPETAKGLAAALGGSPEYWLRLESAYQLWRVGTDDTDAVARRARIYSSGPIKEMVRRGWIEPSDSIDVMERRIADFYEVGTLDQSITFAGYAARKSTSYASIVPTPAQNAWLYRARKLSRAVHATRFTEGKVDDVLARLRLFLHEPQEIRHVPRVLSEAGIKLVIVEALTGTLIDGACIWEHGSPTIALSMRYDRIDSFWFALMHELAHVRDGDKSLDIDLEGAYDDRERPEHERLADAFASECLVPRQRLDNFIARIRPLYSAVRIAGFAQTIKVHPGIVVGQLQHRKELPYANLRKFLVPVRGVLAESALTDGWGVALSV